MAYVTLSQLTDRFGEPMLVALTDRGYPATNTIDTAVVDRAIADTDAVIEGFLVRRYALPLTVTQPLLTDVAGAIAIWKLHTSAPDPKVEADYKAAMQLLRDIAAGTVGLSAAGVEAENVAGSGVQITDRDRLLSQDNMTGFI
jgi:phage gp36-like protein